MAERKPSVLERMWNRHAAKKIKLDDDDAAIGSSLQVQHDQSEPVIDHESDERSQLDTVSNCEISWPTTSDSVTAQCTSDQSILNQPQADNNNSCESGPSPWPKIWTEQQVNGFRDKYPWLVASDGKLGCSACKQASASALIKQQRIHLSTEWINCTIKSTSDDREKQLSAIRGKLKKHLESEAHQMAQKINDTSKKNLLQESTKKLVEKDLLTTERVFRTAYYLA
jgi:hypothetical protein